MDYLEAFKNLKTNNKYSRKSPHKAILLLTVIEMYETNVLSENMILYDDNLKRTFQEVWERTLRDEPLFHPEAYFPFWYMQNENFWHIVPNRGKEDILTLLKDNHVKPSETKLKECVKYAELDEDLYFLMTLPTSRSSLKRVLLETYFDLTQEQIERLSESVDNVVDYSASALSEYKKILSKEKYNVKKKDVATDNELVSQFNNLNEDLQIVLNIQYYSFLKSHRSERELFKEVCPSVYDLFDKIVNCPVRQGEISPSFAFTYDNFLSDLKISLMSEDNAMDLIDKLTEAIDVLRGYNIIESLIDEKTEMIEHEPQHEEIELNNTIDNGSDDEETLPSIIPEKDFGNENRNGKPWTANEEELISLYFEQGQSFSSIAALVGRSENSIKARLAKLGLIEYTYGQDENNNETLKNVEIDYTQGYRIEIKGNRSLIIDKFGKKVFSTSGKLKIIGEDIYRICYTYSSISMNIIRKNERDMFVLGWRILNAHHRTPLYAALDEQRYLEQINSVIYNEEYDEYYVQVDSRLYGSSGYFADLGKEDAVTQRKERTEEQKPSNTSNEDNTIQEETKVDKRIGCVVRLFPSQKKGEIINVRVDHKGIKKLVVKTVNGDIVEVDDLPYLYEILKR